MRSWAAALALAYVAWGCAPDRSIVLTPPPIGTHRSLILVVVAMDPPQILNVAAFDLGDAGFEVLEIPLEEAPVSASTHLEVHALLFDHELSRLRIRPGLQNLRPKPEEARSLPTADSAHSLHIRDLTASDWEPSSAAALQRLTSIEVSHAGGDPCSEFELEIHELPNTSATVATLAVPLDSEHALVMTADGRSFAVGPGESVELTTGSTQTPHSAGFRDGDGTIWLAGPGGTLARGHPSSGFEELPSSESGTSAGFLRIDGSREGPADEVFLVTADRTFERYRDGSWTTLVDEPGVESTRNLSIASVGPGEAYAVGIRGATPLHLAADRIIDEPFMESDGDAANTIVQVPGVGLVLGTQLGKIYARNDSDWAEIGRSPLGGRIQQVVAMEDGFLAVSDDGLMSRYVDGMGYCPTERLTAGTLVEAVRVGRSVVLVARKRGSLTGNERVVILKLAG